MTVWDANISAENESAAAIDDSRTCGLGMDEWMDGWVDKWMDGRDERTDGRTDGQTNGWTDGWINIYRSIN